MRSGYDQGIALQRLPPLPPQLALLDSAQAMQQAQENRQRQLNNEQTEATNPDRAAMLKSQAQGEALGLPVKQLQAREAGISSNYLDQMFGAGASGQQQAAPPSPNIPPYLVNPNGPQQPPPQMQNQFEGKSLAELRQIRSQAGPEGDFLGKFIDPIIKAKSNAEELAPALQELTAVSNKPGATREQAREKAAAAQAIRAKYPALNGDERFEKAAAAALPKNPDVVFNPASMAGVNNRLASTYISKFDHAQEQYEKKVTPLQNLIETKNSPTWGTAAGDVSLINQLSLAEFGGYKPSEAEYKAFGHGFTPAEYAQKWLSIAQSGSVLPDKVRENMVREVENVAKRSHDNFKATMAEQSKRVRAAGIDPSEVIYPGGAFQNLEDYFAKNPQGSATPQQDPAKVALAKQYMALPPNDPNRSAAHDAAAKKILGL